MLAQKPSEKRIILYLANSKPQTINEISKGIRKDYKSTHTAFKRLEKQGLVKTVTVKPYRGREYPCFWLTALGIDNALGKSANPKSLYKQALKLYPENRVLQFLIEAIPVFGEEIANTFGSDILGDPSQVEIGLIGLLSTYLLPTIDLPPPEFQDILSQEQMTQFKALLQKYPELYRRLTIELEQHIEKLKELLDYLQHSE